VGWSSGLFSDVDQSHQVTWPPTARNGLRKVQIPWTFGVFELPVTVRVDSENIMEPLSGKRNFALF
jgi:hypothetical protein